MSENGSAGDGRTSKTARTWGGVVVEEVVPLLLRLLLQLFPAQPDYSQSLS